MRTALFCGIKQGVVVIPYWRFGTTDRSRLQETRIWRWDRQVVPKRRKGITITHHVITQKAQYSSMPMFPKCSIPFSFPDQNFVNNFNREPEECSWCSYWAKGWMIWGSKPSKRKGYVPSPKRPPSLLCNGYQDPFPVVKWAGREVWLPSFKNCQS